MDFAVIIEKLSYQYSNKKDFALKNINLSVRKGEFILIAGKSGSGKSTLLYALNGLIPHYLNGTMQGTVTVCEKDTRKFRIAELSRNVGMVFQNPDAQLFNATVEDEIAFYAENLAYPREKVRECVEFALNAVGIDSYKNRTPYELSAGEKRKVAISTAVSIKPQILVLDEPTADLDAKGKKTILNVIGKLKETGMTIIVAEHNLDDIINYADRLILLDNGTILANNTPKKVFLTQNFTDFGLKAPQTVEIALKLNENQNIPLDVEETIALFKNNLSRIQYNKEKIYRNNNKVIVVKRTPAIEIKNLSFKYEDKMVLDNINLIVNRGDFIGLIGPNGSGKTTLAMLLVGLLKLKKGNIQIDGISVEKGIKKIRKKIGFLFQNPDVQLFCDSVESELMYGFKSHDEELLEEVLRFMDLKKFQNSHPHTLSRGERQRVAIASILTLAPEILILDEPTSGQDWGHLEVLMKLISDIHSNGKTIILITHNMKIIANYCNKVIILKDGIKYYEGDVRKAFSNIHILNEANLNPPLISEISLKCGINPPLLNLEEFNLSK